MINEDYAELIDLDQEEFKKQYNEITKIMKNEKRWFRITNQYKGKTDKLDIKNIVFEEIRDKKHLAIGRSTFYDEFIKNKKIEYGHNLYQSDYLVWINPSNPLESLNFYLDTAQCIDVNLQGLSYDDIKIAINFEKAANSLNELRTKYMTIWEINQILYSKNLTKTIWNFTFKQNEDIIKNILGRLVDEEKIKKYCNKDKNFNNKNIRYET